MAKVALVLHIPDVKADELRQIVHDVDALDSGEALAVATHLVTAENVLDLILSGQYNPEYNILLQKIEDCMSPGPCGDVK